MSSKELRKGFTPTYFSIEDILASQTRIPCKTEINITKFGFLDQSHETVDLPAGSSVELPIWAARQVCQQKRSFVTFKMPKYFTECYREVLKADPTVVDLNKMGPQYYQSGLQLCTLPSEEGEHISEVLPEALLKRVMAMADAYSLNRTWKCTDEVSTSELGNMLRYNYMDPLESQIFNTAQGASEELENWMKG